MGAPGHGTGYLVAGITLVLRTFLSVLVRELVGFTDSKIEGRDFKRWNNIT